MNLQAEMSGNARYYRIADITVRVDADRPITDETFHPHFDRFRVDGPGEDTITVHHHFSPEAFGPLAFGQEVYRRPPWTIYRRGDEWVYCTAPLPGRTTPSKIVLFSGDHDHSRVFTLDPNEAAAFARGRKTSLTTLASDQIVIARVLAKRGGCYVHSSAVALDGKGYLFVGHSEAGKSTSAALLAPVAEVLCDERNIVRSVDGTFRVYGTWSHGDLPDVSPRSAPLRAVLFLEKADVNQVAPVPDRAYSSRSFLSCLIRPLATADWWESMFDLVTALVSKVPAYVLRFRKDADLASMLRGIDSTEDASGKSAS